MFIGPKVNLITINHDVNPENRNATYGRPIVIEDKVWIGINSTILPGVKVGYGAIVGAGSEVTKDVPAMTLWPAILHGSSKRYSLIPVPLTLFKEAFFIRPFGSIKCY